MLQLTENPDLVRRRGRWLSTKIMEIYLQEVQAATYLPSLQDDQRAALTEACDLFPYVLARVLFFTASNIPPQVWYYLLSDRKGACPGKVVVEH